MVAMKLPPRDSSPKPPASVSWLGYGGLVPFLSLALVSLVSNDYAVMARAAVLAYGAIILTFVGALHWAFAMSVADVTAAKRTELYVSSVIPALIAWPALVGVAMYSFTTNGVALAFASGALLIGFAGHFVQDCRLVAQTSLPTWYLPLRLRLTVVACLSIVVASGSALRTGL